MFTIFAAIVFVGFLIGTVGIIICESHPWQEPYESYGVIFAIITMLSILGLLALAFAY